MTQIFLKIIQISIIGAGLIWYAISLIDNTWIYYLLFIAGLWSLRMSYVHLSYLWGGKIWGASKK